MTLLELLPTVQGGWAAALARYTPSAVLRSFEHGEVRLGTIGIAIVIMLLGTAIATIALDLGERPSRRASKVAFAAAIAVIVGWTISFNRLSFDESEDRRNSFPPAHEAALRSIGEPLVLTVHLAGEDPRRVDLEREVLARLRRVMKVDVRYVTSGPTGMTARSDHYGEMIYAIGDRADTTRSVIVPIVLETIYRLANVTPPAEAADASAYPGYPLPRVPSGIALVFFAIWPTAVIAGWAAMRRIV